MKKNMFSGIKLLYYYHVLLKNDLIREKIKNPELSMPSFREVGGRKVCAIPGFFIDL